MQRHSEGIWICVLEWLGKTGSRDFGQNPGSVGFQQVFFFWMFFVKREARHLRTHFRTRLLAEITRFGLFWVLRPSRIPFSKTKIWGLQPTRYQTTWGYIYVVSCPSASWETWPRLRAAFCWGPRGFWHILTEGFGRASEPHAGFWRQLVLVKYANSPFISIILHWTLTDSQLWVSFPPLSWFLPNCTRRLVQTVVKCCNFEAWVERPQWHWEGMPSSFRNARWFMRRHQQCLEVFWAWSANLSWPKPLQKISGG